MAEPHPTTTTKNPVHSRELKKLKAKERVAKSGRKIHASVRATLEKELHGADPAMVLECLGDSHPNQQRYMVPACRALVRVLSDDTDYTHAVQLLHDYTAPSGKVVTQHQLRKWVRDNVAERVEPDALCQKVLRRIPSK